MPDMNDDVRQVIQSAQKEVGRTAAALDQARRQEKKAAERLRAVKGRALNAKSAVSRKAVSAARERVRNAALQRSEAAARHREAKTLLKDQAQLAKSLERKQRAREKAVAAFIKQWDKDYDKTTALKRNNIAARKKIARE